MRIHMVLSGVHINRLQWPKYYNIVIDIGTAMEYYSLIPYSLLSSFL